MRYFGSKASTCESVLAMAKQLVPCGSFCDPFGGIGVMGAKFKKNGYDVWSGDMLRNAYNFQVARIACSRIPRFTRLKAYLGVETTDAIVAFLNRNRANGSWFEREYSEQRQFFTPENAKRIAACKKHIDKWVSLKLVSPQEESLLVASLVECVDKVANTAGTYYAYLKHWYRKALRPFVFELIPTTTGNGKGKAFHEEALSLVSRREFDLLYLDPPYNERCYASYYHLPETLAEHTEPEVAGKAGVPLNRKFKKSPFTVRALATDAFEQILDNAQFRYLFVQYSDDGIIPRSTMRCMLRKYGSLSEKRIKAKGYTTTSRPRVDFHRLLLVSNG